MLTVSLFNIYNDLLREVSYPLFSGQETEMLGKLSEIKKLVLFKKKKKKAFKLVCYLQNSCSSHYILNKWPPCELLGSVKPLLK